MTDYDQHSQQVDTQYNADNINIYQPLLPSDEMQRKRNRARMIERVQAIWIDGVLEPSLHDAAQLGLGLRLQRDAIKSPWRLVIQRLDQTGPLLPAGTHIGWVYDRAGGELLILGEPGAGKTTLLLELARDLLERARRDESHPIPVVFTLSSWSNTRQPLADWLVSELHTKYQIPLPLAASWIKTDQVLPLLDGLDEVAANLRSPCVEAINVYRRTHGLLPTVVCCRQTDYFAFPTRLLLGTAVEVQPLSSQQIETYLSSTGAQMATLSRALSEDEELQTLARTPLMLNILTIAYQSNTSEAITDNGSAGVKREQVFSAYVQHVLARHDPNTLSTQKRAIHWLSWLARQMRQHNQTVFYIEQLQPDWLSGPRMQRAYDWWAVRLPGIFIGVLVSLIINVIYSGSSLSTNIVFAFQGGWLGALLSGEMKRGSPFQRFAQLLGMGVLIGAATGLSFALDNTVSFGLSSDQLHGQNSILIIGLSFGVSFGLCSIPLQILLRSRNTLNASSEMIPSRETRWQRLIRSRDVRNGLLIGLFIGLSYGLGYGLSSGLLYGLSYLQNYGPHYALIVGLSDGLYFGVSEGLSSALMFGLIGWLLSVLLIGRSTAVQPTDRLVWSWRSLGSSLFSQRHFIMTLRVMVLIGLLNLLGDGLSNGLYAILGYGLDNQMATGLIYGLSFGVSDGLFNGLLYGLLYWLLFGLFQGVSGKTIENRLRIVPNQGIHHSAIYGLVLGIISTISVGLAGALSAWSGTTLQARPINWMLSVLSNWFHIAQTNPVSLSYDWLGTGLVTGISAGLLVGLLSGWLACLRHYVLRCQLWQAGSMPRNYARFLDDAAECILLRKVGGGYIFLHRLLLDYLATLKIETASGEKIEEVQITIEALRRIAIMPEPQYHALATRFARYLAEHGVSAWNQDSIPEQVNLKEVIRESSAVTLISSPETSFVPTLKESYTLAVIYQRPLIDIRVLLPNRDADPSAERHGDVHIDALPGREEGAFREALAYVNQQWHSVPPLQDKVVVKQEPRNPYKGLRAFTADDAHDFFGREALIDELAMSLETVLTLDKRESQHGRLLAVVGSGGEGKSSVVLAGLLPCLQSGGVFDSGEWVYLAPIVPGAHPIESLACALFERFPAKSPEAIRMDLQGDAHGFHRYATEFAETNGVSRTNVVLVVDQFEEVFTLTMDEKERQSFIDLLVTACTSHNGPVIVILALRAEFYDRLEQYPALFKLIAEHHKPVLPMSIDELRLVITKPAALADVQIYYDEDLVGDLLFDMQRQVGALPLLQFTLNRLFAKREGQMLTLQSYHEIGGIKDVLSRQAEEIYAALPSQEHRQLACTLFLRLIDPGTTVQDAVPRHVALSELVLSGPKQTEKLRQVIDAFTKADLLTAEEIAGNPAITVSYALIREWPRLASWLAEAREDLRLQQAISADTAEWERHGRARNLLYRAGQLSKAKSWAAHNQPGEKERAFLRTSTRQQVKTLAIWIVAVLFIGSLIGTGGWLLNIFPEPTLVTNLKDSGPGSLRAAIEVAPPGSTITFATGLHGTIRISRYLSLENNLTLRGPGANTLTISAGSTSSDIYVNSATVAISGLAFKNSTNTKYGFGIIYNSSGNLTLSNSIVSGNTGQFGGGITNNGGILTLNNSIVSGNIAQGNSQTQSKDGYGGGIENYNHGTVIINNSIVSDNIAQGVGDGWGFGGGIHNDGTLLITNSTISGNTAQGAKGTQNGDGQGGGIDNDGTLLITNSTISGNTAQSNNKKDGFGGGINNHKGTFYVMNSTISGNIAQGIPGNNTDNRGVGGGIFNQASHAEIYFCTIFGNTAHYYGGGIEFYDAQGEPHSQVTLNNSLIAANNAHTDPNLGDALASPSYITMDSIIVGNLSSANLLYTQPHGNNPVQQRVGNLLIDTHLHNNGGPTQTLALLYGSPAIGAVPLSACYPTIHVPKIKGLPITDLHVTSDQRGVPRPHGSACSVGAYEY